MHKGVKTMRSRLTDLRDKEIVDVENGSRFGCVRDVEIDWEAGRVGALIVPGRLRLFGLLGREEDVVIPLEAVRRFGEDIILIDGNHLPVRRYRRGREER